MRDSEYIGLLMVFWMICVVLAIILGELRGRGGTGFFITLLLGPLGLLLTVLLPDSPAAAASRQIAFEEALAAERRRRAEKAQLAADRRKAQAARPRPPNFVDKLLQGAGMVPRRNVVGIHCPKCETACLPTARRCPKCGHALAAN